VLKAMDLLGADPASTVFIGDSRHDLECGRAAGVRTAAVLWGPFDRAHLDDLGRTTGSPPRTTWTGSR
jgi:pyrophosphatase PpaX